MGAMRPIPPGLPDGLGATLQDMQKELESLRSYVTAQQDVPRSLQELLRGTAVRDAALRSAVLPAVNIFKIETFPNSIVFYLPAAAAWPADTMIELYRAVGAAATSAQAQRVAETTPRIATPSTPGGISIQSVSSAGQVLNDTPPEGETYVYFLRFASLDGERVGPFSPFNGIPFVAATATDPEANFNPGSSGLFLETFENLDFETTWQKYDGGAPALSYPSTGIVGGRVLSVAGAEEWRAFKHNFEFEPGQIYRMKIGLRLTTNPGNGPTSTRARVRAGFMCFDKDRIIVDTTGGSSYVSSHWFCAFDIDLGLVALTTYQEFTGYLQGLGTTPANNAIDVSNPSVARSGTKYWSPVLVVNYDDGTGTTEVDYVRVERLNPLDVAFTGELTNEAVTVPADNAGNVLSYSGAAGTFNVRYGVQPIDPARVTFSISANPQSLTASINSSGVFLVTAGFDSGEATASLTFRAVYNGSTIERTFSLAKALAGADGADGVVTGVRLLSDNQIFTFDQAGAAAPTLQTITFTSLRNGVTDPTTWTTTPSVTLGGVGDTRTLTVADFGANTSVVVRAESEGYFDEITVHAISAGKDALVALLTNESMTLPATEAGVVLSYSGASGFLNVFKGSTDVTAAATKTVNANPQTLTVTGPHATTGAWSITGGFDAGENTATLTFRAVYGGVTVDKTVFLSKAFTGAAGENGDDGTDGVNGGPGPAGTPGPALFTLVPRGNTSLISYNTIQKVGGTVNWGEADAYTTLGLPSCFVTCTPGQIDKEFLFGLSTTPQSTLSYTNINYGIDCDAVGAMRIYELGVFVMNVGAYTTDTLIDIDYDGHAVRYRVNNVVIRTVPILGLTLFAKFSLYNPGSRVNNIAFGPQGKSGDVAAQLVFLETWEHQNWPAFYNNRANGGGLVTDYPTDGEFGGRVLRASNALLWIAALENVPYDPGTLYKITAKVRRTVASGVGQELCYVGVEGVAADGVTLININGANAFSSQHYNCFLAFDLGGVALNQWVEHTGYFRGLSSVGGAGAVQAPNVENPTPLFNGVRYFRPLIILNYSGGNGAQECDYIRVERLTAPDDADNTDKRRIVPDAEFSLATDQTFWTRNPAPTITIALTGGFNGGYASWVMNGVSQAIYSRRNPPFPAIAGQQFIVTVRWRRRNTLVDAGASNGVFRVGLVRHNAADGSVIPFTPFTEGYGGVALYTGEINSRTVDAWQEDSGLCVLPTNANPFTAINLPFASAAALAQNFASGTIEIDMIDIAPGTPASVPRLEPPGSGNYFMNPWDLYHLITHSGASARTFFLFGPNVNFGKLAAKVYFQQMGTGQMNISYAGTLLSSPNLSIKPRPLLGKSARAFAEYTGDGSGSGGPLDNYTLTGELG